MNRTELLHFFFNNKLNILVKPNSSKNSIIGWDYEKKMLKIEINGVPKDNEVNIEILKFFNREFKLDLKIVKGFKSRKKTVELK